MLSDVGIAKQRQLDAAATGRTYTLIKGTPSHLDPEYVRTGERRAETDGYALGMVRAAAPPQPRTHSLLAERLVPR